MQSAAAICALATAAASVAICVAVPPVTQPRQLKPIAIVPTMQGQNQIALDGR
jgi:hypothetical protein